MSLHSVVLATEVYGLYYVGDSLPRFFSSPKVLTNPNDQVNQLFREFAKFFISSSVVVATAPFINACILESIFGSNNSHIHVAYGIGIISLSCLKTAYQLST
ncbi:MAG: hypothetical protein LLF94_05050 [Chlamydiales bacterium]|nr:hypothetical protein [Chlamydiales bacterium]